MDAVTTCQKKLKSRHPYITFIPETDLPSGTHNLKKKKIICTLGKEKN